MTTNNPFADRIHNAAKEGYVNSSTRYAYREYAAPSLGASPKQIALIQSLLSERDLAAETRPKFRARLFRLTADHREVAELDRDKASALITYLFGLPSRSVAQVPAGHYALERDGEIQFYRVDRPIEGKWAGKVFVNLLHGPDETSMGLLAGVTILGYIVEQGIQDCSIRYGRAIGKCGICNRRLTNEESRAAGIGPICAEKFSL